MDHEKSFAEMVIDAFGFWPSGWHRSDQEKEHFSEIILQFHAAQQAAKTKQQPKE